MVRSTFPNIDALKSQIAARRKNGDGWFSVLLNVKTAKEYRPDIDGTLSLFMNLQGESVCAVERKRVKILEPFYLLVNDRQRYTLDINSPVETFNVHFGSRLISDVYQGLTLPSDKLLLSPSVEEKTVEFYNKLYPKTSALNQIIKNIQAARANEMLTTLRFEELLSEIFEQLLIAHRNLHREISNMPLLKAATRAELYKRLALAQDYLYENYAKPIELDDLARVAAISKFHFLRLFKSTFQQTPHQFILSLRLEQAQTLLKKTSMPIHDVAFAVGFENLASFSRLFHQRFHRSPKRFRAAC